MTKRLVVLAGPDEGRVFTLGSDPVLLGRSRATDSRLIDPHVSRVHCQVAPEGDQQIISDFDSAGGTFVNGVRITKQPLKAGDLIRIGSTRLQYFEEAEPVEASPSATASLSGASTVTLQGNWARQLTGQMFTHYKIGSILAQGKAGYVFHARDTRKNLEVALKILDARFGADKKSLQRFVKAMKIVLPLKHPNLVKMYGAGKTGHHCWVAMEYVSGESLAAVIGRIEGSGLIDWRHVLRVLVYMTRALIYAHGKKIVHQCVTPQNILLGKAMQQTKLADLMLAGAVERNPTIAINADDEPSEDLPYMSPEQTDGPDKPVDARTDIYSLGATVFALLTGRPPFQAKTPAELVNRIRLQAPPAVSSLYPGLPEPLEMLILRMLAKRVQDRPQSARDLLKEIQAVAKSQSLTLSES